MIKIRINFKIKRGIGRIGSVLLLICVVTLIACGQRGAEPEQSAGYTLFQKSDRAFSEKDNSQVGYTEDKERNREEGITFTVDETQKEILTSYNGEICVKIPQWNGFINTYLTENYGYEKLSMSNVNYDSMTYELIASWDVEEVEEEILEDFSYHLREHILGEIYHMTVDGIEIYYLPCYHDINSKSIKWHYTVWADLGCGQVLKTEITQGMLGYETWEEASEKETITYAVTKPLNIEGMIEALYSNIEVCSVEGDPIKVAYRELLPEDDENVSNKFSFGIVREYKTDMYREITACGELIESLHEAVQSGTIQELLQQEKSKETEMSIAEKMDYIKKEETGRLIRYDSGSTYVREGTYPPTKYFLVEGADASEEFLVHCKYDLWDERFDYMWFKCEKDSSGNIRAQKGICVFGTDTDEHYFLSYKGDPYLCIANRDVAGKIESVVLYDFETPDYIGTLIYIDDSAVRICSYIRNEGTYGTEMPWYLFDNRIDSGKEYYAMLEQWKITEYLGESVYRYIGDISSEAYVKEQELTQSLKDTYLDQEINMSWDRKHHDVTSFHSASEYGYYYTSWENLYKVYGQPETLVMEAPFSCATLQVHDFEEDIDIIVDKNGKAAICVEGRFFLLEKSGEEVEEIRTWE